MNDKPSIEGKEPITHSQLNGFRANPCRVACDKPSIEERELCSISTTVFVRECFAILKRCFSSEATLHIAKLECSKRSAEIRSFGAQFEPRYIFRAGRLDQ